MICTTEMVGEGVIRKYSEQSEEFWKPDHVSAMMCRNLEDYLRLGLCLYQFLNDADERWRVRVMKGQIEYSRDVDRAIRSLYREWLNPSDRIMETIANFERSGFQVDAKDEFLAARREVIGLLTPDDEFFDDGEFEPLRKAAESEHRAGQTEVF